MKSLQAGFLHVHCAHIPSYLTMKVVIAVASIKCAVKSHIKFFRTLFMVIQESLTPQSWKSGALDGLRTQTLLEQLKRAEKYSSPSLCNFQLVLGTVATCFSFGIVEGIVV